MNNNVCIGLIIALTISTGFLSYERASYTDLLDLKLLSSSKQIEDQISFHIDRGSDLSYKVYQLTNELDSCTDEKDEYISALDEANNNISNAKYSTWESYDDMGYALEGLEEVYVY